jgi:hypothetical protein
MFPNAPEKAQSAGCFRGLKPTMSINSVVQKCGRPDEELGSGLYIFVWHFSDVQRSPSERLLWKELETLGTPAHREKAHPFFTANDHFVGLQDSRRTVTPDT